MNTSRIFSANRLPILALALSLFLVACGGSSSSDTPTPVDVTPATGFIGLLFTDKPTDEFSAIKLNVIEAILISDGGHQTVFQGSEPIDLLDLTNFNEPIIFGEVDAGTYTKLRLIIDELELVPHDGSPSIYPKLPANGKIDMLDPEGFDVLPGRTLLVEIDMDANKSIKITETGNSSKYNFRPVVRVNFMDGGLPDKLARVEGIVSEIYADPAGSYKLCDIETPSSCIDVLTGAGASIFDDQGLATDFSTLTVNAHVVVIGRYVVDTNIALDSVVLEIGGNAEQIKGNVVSAPMDNQFLILTNENGDMVVELQTDTKFFDASGEIGSDSIVIGADIEVEGVQPAKADPADPDLIRAALVFVEAEDDEQLSGTIIDPFRPLEAPRSFGLMPVDGGDTCVRVKDDAAILLVDTVASEVTVGTIDDLELGQMVDLFGLPAADSCFEANEVIVDVAP